MMTTITIITTDGYWFVLREICFAIMVFMYHNDNTSVVLSLITTFSQLNILNIYNYDILNLKSGLSYNFEKFQ